MRFKDFLSEKCWDGYKQVGMKKKGDKMVPDCVPEESEEVEEAVSAAQQAAIAISKKEKGEKPKNEDAEEKARLALKHTQEKERLAQKHEREKAALSNEEYLDSIDHILDEEFGFAMFEEEIIKERDGVYNIKGVKIVLKKKGDKYHATMDGKDAGTHDSEKKAMQWISKKMYLSPKAKARYAEGKSVLGDARTILYREKLKRLGYVKEETDLDEATIKDILTTIGSSKNMDQAVQMVMKKYKVDQGKAKAMVKKAIDSGVTYDKIKKKYAKESVNEETRLKVGDKVQTPQGTVEIKKRDTRGMRGKQDDYEMILTMKDGKKVSMGSHPQPFASAVKNIAKRHFSKGIPSYMAHNVIESVEEKRDAGKSATGYDIYHDTYSAAMQHAYAHAKKKHGVTVRPSEIDDKVASGPRKPSTGKTVSHILKTDKKQNLHVQVYNTGRKYELNMYVESVNEASKVPAGMKFIASYVYKDANGKDHTHTHLRKGKKMTDPVVVHIDGKEWKTFQSFTKAKQAAISHIKSMKEEVELDEANAIDLARDVVKNKGAKKGLDMQTANAILTVYDKVNDANKKKMEKMPVDKLANAVWKILNKAS